MDGFAASFEPSRPVTFPPPEADLADDRFDAPEASGLDVLCRGLSMVADDPTVLALTGTLFDGLYEYCRRAMLGWPHPAGGTA